MDRRRLNKRFMLPAAVATVFAGLAALHIAGLDALYDRILGVWGIVPFAFPFVDVHGVLSAIACSAHGIDVYVTNPCDVLGRVFFYSPLLLWAAPTGIGVGATPAAGLIVDLAFILSLALLPVPRMRPERRLFIAAALSSAAALGLERANIDLMIFAMIAIVARLLLHGTRARMVAYALLGAAALLKFYPAAAFALAARERPRRFAAIAGAAVTVGTIFVVVYHAELAQALGNVPSGKWFQDMFGARNLPYGLTALGIVSAPPLLYAAMAAAAGIGALALGRSPATNTYARLDAAEATFLVIGAAIVVGCFFAGQSYTYRSVFLIMTLPGLSAMARESASPLSRPLLTAAAVGVLLLMWEETARQAVAVAAPGAMFAFWLGRELVWWSVMTVLGGVLVRFVGSVDIADATLAWLDWRGSGRRILPR